MKIRNIEFDFNFFDADDFEKFERELIVVKEKCQKEEIKNLKVSEVIKKECKIIKDFFDNVFGEGTAFKIFGEKNNLQDCISAYEDIVNEKIKQQQDLQNTFDKYSPNRSQRRAKK